MMMKKTTSALAVAALLGTGAASAATFQVNDDTSLTVGGDIMYIYQDVNNTTGDGVSSFQDNGSSLVFAGEQAHDNGIVTSFYLDLDGFGTLGEDDASSDFVTDEYHISFAGDFGEVKIGEEGDVIGPVLDVADIANAEDMIVGGGDSTEVVQYYSNDLNGISYALQAQVNGDSQENTNGSSTSFSGYIQSDLGGLTIGAGYDQRANSQDEPIAGLMVSTALAGVDVTASYVQDDETDAENDRIAIAASYSYGPGSVYGAVNSVSFDEAPTGEEAGGTGTDVQSSKDLTQTMVGVSYSIAANASVYGEVQAFDLDEDEKDTMAVGLNYSW